MRLLAVVGIIVALAGLSLSAAQAQTSGNWSTYLDNGGRTGYNGAEWLIAPSTARNLTKRWTDGTGSISAEPIQVNGVVYYGSWDGNEYAVKAGTGTRLWSTYVGQSSGGADCFGPASVGVASTATVGTITVHGIATRAVFVGGGAGAVYALNASTGRVIWKTQLGDPAAAYFLYSSPVLYHGSIYEGVASFGDCPPVRGGMVRMDAATGTVQKTFYTVPASCNGADVWGSPTVDTATGDIYFATSNAGSCSSGPESLAVALIQTDSSLNLKSSWQIPPAQLPNGDSDFGSTPTLFQASIHGVVHQMVGIQNKDGVYYAFDRSAISSGPLWQQRMAIGGECPECGDADISPSAYDGQHLFVGGAQTQINGVTCAGSIRELQPATGATVWATCLQSGPVLGAVTAVPGLAFVGAGNTVYAVAIRTGAILWRYQDTSGGSDFWGAPTISNGQVYVGNQDGNLYAFGASGSIFGLKSLAVKFG